MKQTLIDQNRIELKDVRLAQKWFDEKIRGISPIGAKAFIRESGARASATVRPGNLYAFMYMPIGAATLPYYDTFPLVFPLSSTKDTFFGLNMHYLPYPTRFAVFKELVKIGGVPGLTDAKRMSLKWEMIAGVSKLAPLQACIKQYRFDAVGSPFMEIKQQDWATAMLLPTQSFKKSSASTVWKDTLTNRKW